MARISVLALLGVALAGFSQGNPLSLQKALDNSPIHTTNSWEYNDCGLDSDIIQLKSISVSPDPPQPGQDLTVTVVAEATDTIEDGAYADVTVKLGLIKLLHKQFDVCQEARNAENIDLQCPVEKGDHTVTATVALPKEIPPAKFVVEVRAYSKDDADLVCVNLKVDFLSRNKLMSPLREIAW